MGADAQRATVSTPWGGARAIEDAWVAQTAGEAEFSSGVQLLETADGQRLVRFAYTTDGRVRRGPVTLRLADVERLAEHLRERPALRAALAALVGRRR
jgi:hypothetical protein